MQIAYRVASMHYGRTVDAMVTKWGVKRQKSHDAVLLT